jgi:xylan 1,4-beta-xylosidase
MLLYWGFAWEDDEDEFFAGKRELMTAGHTPKPVQTGFELLACLGPERLEVERIGGEHQMGILASRSDGDTLAMIVYNYLESDPLKGETQTLQIEFSGLRRNGEYLFSEIPLDRTNNNTYFAWKAIGKPASSRGIDLSTLNEAANLTVTDSYVIQANRKGNARLKLDLERHSMKLLKIVPAKD